MAVFALLVVLAVPCAALASPAAVTTSAVATEAKGDRFQNQRIGKSDETAASADQAEASPAGPSATRVVVSLGVVVVLIVGLGGLYRRVFGGEAPVKATGAVRLVSRNVITPKHQVMILQVGRRLVVVGDGGQGMQTLSEITDPDEVAELLGRGSVSGSLFGATLDAAEGSYDPDEAAVPTPDDGYSESPPDPALDDARTEVRGLIDRVRQISASLGRNSA